MASKSSPELKVKFTADTAEFSRGAKAAQSELRAFGRAGDTVLSRFGNALGVNAAKVGDMSKAVTGMGRTLSQSGSAGVKAFGAIVTSAGAASVAIGALGIGAAVAAFKRLSAEAENFKNTIAGADIELKTQAYVSTYSQMLHDMHTATARHMAEAESDFKKFMGRLKSDWANFQLSLIEAVMQKQPQLGPGLGGYIGMAYATSRAQHIIAKNSGKAERAEAIAGELFDLRKQQLDKELEVAKLTTDIANQQLIIRDAEATTAEKAAALAEAKRLISEREQLQLPIAQKIAELIAERNALTNSSLDDIREQVDAAKAAQTIQQQALSSARELQRSAKTIAKEAAKEAQARKDALAALQAEAAFNEKKAKDSSIFKAAIQPVADEDLLAKYNKVLVPTEPLKIPVVADTSEAQTQMLDFSQSVVSGLETMSQAVGTFIGELLSGGDAGTQFGQAILSMFGDLAIGVGRIAIAVGVASLGLKAALANPVAAIAAGSALVALGSMVKAAWSSATSGNSYSATSNLASSGYSSSGSDYMTREMKVKVTGTLVANGSQLVAVLNNEEDRRNHTT